MRKKSKQKNGKNNNNCEFVLKFSFHGEPKRIDREWQE